MSLPTGLRAAIELMKIASTVDFQVLDTFVETTASGDDSVVTINVQLGDAEEDFGAPDHEWGGLPLMYALLVLSFHDARPRGASGMWFEDQDHFEVADLLQAFRFERGGLTASVDYLRGRCVKTDIRLDNTGKLTLHTRTRGEAATRWLSRLKGEKALTVVE